MRVWCDETSFENCEIVNVKLHHLLYFILNSLTLRSRWMM